MKLTVLGKYGPFPAPGGACSGYLLECGSKKLLLDLGSGTLSRLLQLQGSLKIDAVLLSHLHSDHMADMLILRYALQQLRSRGQDVPMPLTVIAPDSPEEEFRLLSTSGVFDITAAQDKLRARIDDITITLHRMTHPVPTYAFSITHEGRKLFYTGDTGWREDLTELCRGADLLLADTCFTDADRKYAVSAHLTASEAGRIAREAGVKQLVCTHLWGGGPTPDITLKEASARFPDTVVAEEMRSYLI